MQQRCASVDFAQDSPRTKSRGSPWLVYALILMGAIARLVPHAWNTTPVMAIALFAGAYLPKRWGILVPLAIVAATDWIIGWHNTVAFTWAAFALCGSLGFWIRKKHTLGRIVVAALGGSVLFFLITNFGVWLVGELYPRTIDGLWACFIAAIPFFRNSLAGDLLYTAAFFGVPQLIAAARAGQIAHNPQ